MMSYIIKCVYDTEKRYKEYECQTHLSGIKCTCGESDLTHHYYYDIPSVFLY